MHTKRYLLAPLLLLLTMFSSAPTLAQTGAGWTTPYPVSETVRTSWFSDIAATPDGAVYILWTTGVVVDASQGIGADLLMYRELRNGQWSEAFDVANPYTGKSSYAIRNSIVANRDGRLHVLVRGPNDIDYISAPTNETLSIQYWSDPRRLNGTGLPYYTAIAADAVGNLHAAWNEVTTRDDLENCACYDIFYRSMAISNHNWFTPINLSESRGTAIKPQIATDATDRVHVIWTEDPPPVDGQAAAVGGTTGTGDGPGGVYYRRSPDGGQSWDPPVRFMLPQEALKPTATPEPQLPGAPLPTPGAAAARELATQGALGIYRKSDPIVVYRTTGDDQLVYFQTSRDGGENWEPARPIASVRARPYDDTPFDGYSMVTDGSGNVHLFMVGITASEARPKELAGESLRGIQPRLLHLVWNGSTWSQPTVIVTDGLYPEWPQAVAVGRTLHVTWFTRNAEDRYSSENSKYQVWYSRRQLAGPAVASLPTFTPTAVIVPTATAAPPTPVPTPTLSPFEIESPELENRRPSWELQGYQVMVLALLPVLLLLGGFFGWIVWTRRQPPRPRR